jgi:hypothetical protein
MVRYDSMQGKFFHGIFPLSTLWKMLLNGIFHQNRSNEKHRFDLRNRDGYPGKL